MQKYHVGREFFDDLLQEARVAFLKHLRRMGSVEDMELCGYQILRELRAWRVAMFPIHISKNRFKEEAGRFLIVSMDEMDPSLHASTFEEAPDDEIMLRQFLDSLSQQERRIVDMKLQGYNGHEIALRTGYGSESKISRMLSNVRKRYVDTFGEAATYA